MCCVPVLPLGEDLDRWLTPFLDVMGRSTRRRWGPLYVRGLLGPDGPKSVQPIAARLGLRGHDQLHHFVSSAAWDDAPLWRVLAEQADDLVGGPDAVLVIDDTGVPKKGTPSVGVAAQYCGELGKQANCQSLVSLTLARGEVPVPGVCGCFCQRSGPTIRPDARRPGSPRRPVAADQARDRAGRNRSRHRRRATVRLRAGGCRIRPWRAVPPRAERARPDLGGRRSPHRKSSRPRPSRCGRTPVAEGPASRPCRVRPARMPPRVGGCLWRRVVGGKAPKAHSPRASPPCACAWPMAHRARHATCPAKKSGSSGNGAAAASANTISAIFRCAPRCAAVTGGDDQGALGLRAGASAAQAGTRTRHSEGRSWTGCTHTRS